VMQDGERFLFSVVHKDSRGSFKLKTRAFSTQVTCIYNRTTTLPLSAGSMKPL